MSSSHVNNRNNSDPNYFEEQEKWNRDVPSMKIKKGEYKLFCGIHAFNNLVGKRLLTKESVFDIIGVNVNERPYHEGNFLNDELEFAINILTDGKYTAFSDVLYMSRTNVNNANRMNFQSRLVDIFSEPALVNKPDGGKYAMTEEIKEYIANIYFLLLSVRRRIPELTGFILQMSYGGGSMGHYVAIKKLRNGYVHIIDSMDKHNTYEPIPLFTENDSEFRKNCATFIKILFKMASITFRTKKFGPPSHKYLQFIIVKPGGGANN